MAWLIQVPSVPQYQPQFEFLDKPEGYDHWALQKAITISSEDMPGAAKIFSGHKKIHDFFNVETEHAVSRRFKDIIEAFEPGVHQFFPIRLLRKNGEPFEGEYFLLNIRVAIAALDLDRSELHWTASGPAQEDRLPHISYSGRIVLNKGLIEGHHLWRHNLMRRRQGREYSITETEIFVSEELFREAEQNKIKKYWARHAEEICDGDDAAP